MPLLWLAPAVLQMECKKRTPRMGQSPSEQQHWFGSRESGFCTVPSWWGRANRDILQEATSLEGESDRMKVIEWKKSLCVVDSILLWVTYSPQEFFFSPRILPLKSKSQAVFCLFIWVGEFWFVFGFVGVCLWVFLFACFWVFFIKEKQEPYDFLNEKTLRFLELYSWLLKACD